MQASAVAMNAEVAYLSELTQEHTCRDLPIALTELNSSPTGVQYQPASPDSHFNAIWYADVLGRLMTDDLAGVSPAEADVWLLDVEHNAANLGKQAWSADGTVTLPAQSVTLYVIS